MAWRSGCGALVGGLAVAGAVGCSDAPWQPPGHLVDARIIDAAPLDADPFAGPRAIVDLPDDVTGAQVHVLYVVPADAPASATLDSSGALRREVTAFNRWLQLRLGASLRIDTAANAIDVTYVRLDADDATMATGDGLVPSGPRRIRERLEVALMPTFADPTKLYLIYYDGLVFGSCGEAARPTHMPVVFVGGVWTSSYLTTAATAGATSVAVYDPTILPLPATPFAATLGGAAVTVTSVVGSTATLAQPLAMPAAVGALLLPDARPADCRTNPMSVDGDALGYATFVGVHEVMHALGLAPDEALDVAAPPTFPGHLDVDNPAGTADLMYQGDQPWMCQQFAANAAASPCALDPAHRNYVEVTHGGADLADSAFLEPLPANPVMPSGW